MYLVCLLVFISIHFGMLSDFEPVSFALSIHRRGLDSVIGVKRQNLVSNQCVMLNGT